MDIGLWTRVRIHHGARAGSTGRALGRTTMAGLLGTGRIGWTTQVARLRAAEITDRH